MTTITFTGLGAVGVLVCIGCALWAYCLFMDWTFKMAVGGASQVCISSDDEPAATLEWVEVDSLEPDYAQTVLDDFVEDEAQTTLDDFTHTCTGECRHAHMVWAKGRAIDLLPDIAQARASLLSDLGKHPETEGVQQMFAPMLMLAPFDEGQFRAFVEGFGEGTCDCATHTCAWDDDGDIYEQVMVHVNEALAQDEGGEEE